MPASDEMQQYPTKRPGWLGQFQTWPCGRCGKNVDDSAPHLCPDDPKCGDPYDCHAVKASSDILGELQRAVEKHGFDRTPMNPDMDRRDAYIIIAEEVGEVARALTYDGVNRHKLEDELLQVAAMAVAMLIGVRSKGERC